MISSQDIEQFIPFIKPLFDGLRAARDFFRRDRRPEHAIGIPQKTLILLPDVHTHALRWCLGKAGEKEAMQISGSLQGTNTSRYAVRAADIKLLEPTRVAVLTQTITIGDPESGMHSTWHLIPAGHIGELSFMFFVTPVVGTPGRPLTATISVLDQFGNEHVMRDLQFKFMGPEKLP
jgi:hypothetical protein